MVPGTSYLLTREFFDDWSGAEPSRLEIECLDAPASTWPVMSADRVSKELEAIGQWLVETVRTFGSAHVRGLHEFANAFEPRAVRADSDLPTIYHGFWNLAADECLLIETPEPEGDYWGFQLSNALWNTLDYANRQTSLNRTQAHVDADGQLRIVLANEDPGVPNWLDTLGHQEGAIHVRLSPVRRAAPARSQQDLAETVNDWMSGWGRRLPREVGPRDASRASARVVKLADLRAELPRDTPTVRPGGSCADPGRSGCARSPGCSGADRPPVTRSADQGGQRVPERFRDRRRPAGQPVDVHVDEVAGRRRMRRSRRA